MDISGPRCPRCGNKTALPSRTRGFFEHLRKKLLLQHAYRYTTCQKRFMASLKGLNSMG
jgi:hypothetical protein